MRLKMVKRNVNSLLFFLLVLSLAVNVIVVLFLDKTLTALENKANLSSAEFVRNISSCLNDSFKLNATMHQVVDYCNLKVDKAVNQTKEEYFNFSITYLNQTQWSNQIYRDKLMDCATRYSDLRERIKTCDCPFV